MHLIALAVALLVALSIDRWWGEPRVRLHPVVWMGNYLGWAGHWLQRRTLQDPRQRDLKEFWLGAQVWIAGAATIFVAAWLLQAVCLALPW